MIRSPEVHEENTKTCVQTASNTSIHAWNPLETVCALTDTLEEYIDTLEEYI
jgi:hypothetical protein